ncbi:HEAT repeat domain-containing protein [Actinosynnema sp. NPDC002837]
MSAAIGEADSSTVTDEITRLIGLLNDDSIEVVRNAEAELISMGGEVVRPLADAVGSLDAYGQLCAIEVFDHFGDPAAGPALIGLLGSEDEAVRRWSTWSVGELRLREAVPALSAARERLRAEGGPPDGGEAVEVRRALTRLGARREVWPPLTASLRTRARDLPRAWPSDRLAEVVDDLADHDQAVLGFRLALVFPAHTTWVSHEGLDLRLDVRKPWPQVVEDARESALVEAAFVEPRPNLFATLQWIGRDDV